MAGNSTAITAETFTKIFQGKTQVTLGTSAGAGGYYGTKDVDITQLIVGGAPKQVFCFEEILLTDKGQPIRRLTPLPITEISYATGVVTKMATYTTAVRRDESIGSDRAILTILYYHSTATLNEVKDIYYYVSSFDAPTSLVVS